MLSVTSIQSRPASGYDSAYARCQYAHRHGLPGNEADLVGPFPGRHGAHADRNAVLGSVQLFFIGFLGVYHEY